MSTLQMPNEKESSLGSVLSAAFWIASTAGFAALAANSALPFGRASLASWEALLAACDRHPIATVFVLAWAIMVFAALSALVRRAVGVRGTWGASVALTLAGVIALAERMSAGEVTSLDSDRGAILMVAAAFAYAGSSRLWWMLLGPILATVALLPVAWLEFWEAARTGVLVRAAFPVVAAAVLASIAIVIRETRSRVVDARAGIADVASREENIAHSLIEFSRALARSGRVGELANAAPMPSLAEAVEATAAGVRPEDVLKASSQTTTVEIEAPEAAAQTPTSSVTYQDLQSLASEALEVVRTKWSGRSDVRLLLTAPMDLSLPIAVRANPDEVRLWLRSLVENAVDALGGGRGVVRLTLKPTLTHVAIAVEDNGRGLGEDLYKKLGVQDPARLGLDDVKAQAARQGARLDLHSRLGVGTRATLELSRIDALSALTRATSARNRMSLDSNSMHA